MRIHSLTMTAIGPYPGTERIDFDAFGDSGRFLLTGPTGSGKTTIIDAIVFALYGSVADSEDSSKDRIRSTLASPEVASVVELVFSTGSGIYRVRRTPAYERAKKRGTGTTTQGATVKLWRLSSVHGDALDDPVTRAEEAGAEITRAVGLSREQFTQTVVLPQGKFARFLRSPSAERQELLRDVFGTGLYQRIEQQLAEDAGAERKRVEAARAALASAGAQLAALPQTQAVGLAGETTEALMPRQAAPDPTAMRQSAQALQEASAARVEEAGQRRATAAEQERGAREALDAAHSTHAALERRAELLAEQAELAKRQEQDAESAARLEVAERAARVVPALDAACRASSTAGKALQALRARLGGPDDDAPAHVAALHLRTADAAAPLLAQTEAAWQRLGEAMRSDEPHGPADPAPAPGAGAVPHGPSAPGGPEAGAGIEAPTALEELAAGLAQEEGELVALARIEAGLSERRSEAEELHASLGPMQARVKAIDEELTVTWPQEAERLRGQVEGAQEAGARIDGLVAAEEAAASRDKAARSVPSLLKQAAARKDALLAAAEHAREAAQRVLATRSSWISSTSGTLAGELRDGEPCPVCGATEHPSPATIASDGPTTRADIEAAEEASRSAADALDLARREHDAAEHARDRAEREAEGASPEEAAAALAQARAALRQARERAASLSSLRALLRQHEDRARSLREEQSRLQARMAEVAERVKAMREAHDADLAACQDARGHWPSIAARRQDLRLAAAEAHSVAGAVSKARGAFEDAEQALHEAMSALRSEGFACQSAAREAALAAGELDSLRKAVTEAAAQRTRVAQELAAPRIAALSEDHQDPLPAAREAHDAATTTLRQAADVASRAEEAHRQVEAAAAAVAAAAGDYEAVIGDAATLLNVADLARGNNPASTPLSSWVLLSRFEEVLVFANERLTQISSGRYELIRVDDESGSRAHRKGLGLAVVDHLDEHGRGRARDPKTLSGGETFYVSLSLALALADVVSAESGGVSLDTLFIDEGFGTLDPATLSAVMAQIDQLRQGGRTVGLVSHVAELREQIPDRITVRRTDQGGSTLAITGS
ncbi:AAA family ATPase [Actinomyces slackii]|uniref:Nuclease SbcCD subunit C n=1 Tax=Actinomyces slackii TaxID=52774 RepID=A0A448KFV4_9ACTO|nr:SMC family ATPase [Actinomyces slackii]VEG75823.1 Nuclease sbcCD subunit C [Actinomyces slackii]